MSMLINRYRRADTTGRTQLAGALETVLSLSTSRQSSSSMNVSSFAVLLMHQDAAGPDPAAAKTLLRTLDDAERLAHKVSGSGS